MKLSDYVAARVAELGARDVFAVTGGGAMHLNQSLAAHPDLTCWYQHHEQACAIAAEGYFRVNNQVAVVNVTTGPGATNAITGVFGAWTDSCAMVVLSGQVKRSTTIAASGLALRQLGDQEVDITRIIEPLTKYSCVVDAPDSIRYHLEKAFHLARRGRPGPVWLDIPVDVQGAQIDPASLPGFDPSELDEPWANADVPGMATTVLDAVRAAERPVIIAGGGIRLSGQIGAFHRLVDRLGIPVATTFNGRDTLWHTHPQYAGRPGTIGDRAGNFAVQNADLVLVLGSRLNIRQISYNWDSFARGAVRICVDVDPLELQKPTVRVDIPIVADLADFLPALLAADYAGPTAAHRDWNEWCRERVRRYPVLQPHMELEPGRPLNPYGWMKALFDTLPAGQIVVSANATACIASFQAGELRPGQRHWSNSGSATMGYDLPAAIGATIAADGAPVVCLAGDGSIMMNLQELQTIATHRLAVKIFLLNNAGYSSIAQTHRNLFDGVEVGCGEKSGVGFPAFELLAQAFGIAYERCDAAGRVGESIARTMARPGPVLCEVVLDPTQGFEPKLASRRLPDGTMVSPSLEDMSPFLSREELADNMLVSAPTE